MIPLSVQNRTLQFMDIFQDDSVLTPSFVQQCWDERYSTGANPAGGEIGAWTLAQQPYLTGGRALDFACGIGRHTLWLAELDYQVDAVDISKAGLQNLAERARRAGFRNDIHLIQADLTEWRPEKAVYDLVFVTRYLDRDAFPNLIEAVRSGGLLLYRTFHTDLLRLRDYESTFLLQPGELLQAFAHLQILAYEERRLLPDSTDRNDCTSAILVRKP